MEKHYMPLLGPNTNQWWVYESAEDVYIDVPQVVLKEVKQLDYDEQENALYAILEGKPQWLEDKEHWYSDIEI